MENKVIVKIVALFFVIISCHQQNKVSDNELTEEDLLSSYYSYQKDSISSLYFKTCKGGLLHDTLLIFNKDLSLVRGQVWREGFLVKDSLSMPMFKMELDNTSDVYSYKSVCLFFDSIKKVSVNTEEIYNGDTTIIQIYNLPDIYALTMPATKLLYDGENRFKAIFVGTERKVVVSVFV